MYHIKAEMYLSDSPAVWAYGNITLEGCVRFGVQIRKYADKETGEEKMFVGMPRRERNGVWEDVVKPDEQLREEIEVAVVDALKQKMLSDINLPDVEVVSVTRIRPHAPEGAKAYICGLATVRMCGITIHGITIKNGSNGLFVNMPQYRSNDGYRDVVYATNKSMQEKIRRAVLEKYKMGTERSGENGPEKI